MLWQPIINVGQFTFTLDELIEYLDLYTLDDIQLMYKNGAFDVTTKRLLGSYLRKRIAEKFEI